METWIKIDGTGGQYSISDCGNVRNNRSGKLLKKYLRQPQGDMLVTIRYFGNPKTVHVTTLVAQAFLGGGKQYTHLNGDRADDRVCNLQER